MKQSKIQNIVDRITNRNENYFASDLQKNRDLIRKKAENKAALIIGGAGSIGSSFIKQLLNYGIQRLCIVDVNENGLAEIVRDIRSSSCENIPEIRTYPISFSSGIFKKILHNHQPFEIVANFAALKHVRSEKDPYAIEAMFENNFVQTVNLVRLLQHCRPEYFFSVSSDKASNPASIMGATKKLMEDAIFSNTDSFNTTTARFANVAFSNGSLLESYISRFDKDQPIVCPVDIHRYFISAEEAGSLCLLACFLGSSGEIFVPNFHKKDLVHFPDTVEAFFNELSIDIEICQSECEAKSKIEQNRNMLDKKYPVYLFSTDTSGEKPYEEFYRDDEEVDWDKFGSLGVIKYRNEMDLDMTEILLEASHIFENISSKTQIIDFLQKYVPNFEHKEVGKNLDDKM